MQPTLFAAACSSVCLDRSTLSTGRASTGAAAETGASPATTADHTFVPTRAAARSTAAPMRTTGRRESRPRKTVRFMGSPTSLSRAGELAGTDIPWTPKPLALPHGQIVGKRQEELLLDVP